MAVAAALTAGVLAFTPQAVPASSERLEDPRPTIQPLVPLGSPGVTIRDRTLPPAATARRLRAMTRSFSGGTYYTAAGEPVTWYLSDFYRPDNALTQQYVDFLGATVHADEISSVSIYVLSPAEMAAVCPDAVACYGRGDLFVQGEAGADGTPIVEALVHEYGHHVAATRSNEPFPGGASDWGTKRWASYEGVCPRVLEGTASPGDEGDRYAQNPGEAFADSYRILNGGNPDVWQYDGNFYPDATSLAAIRQDVVEPHEGLTDQREFEGRFPARGSATKVVGHISTPLDGTVELDLVRFGRLRATAYVVDPADNTYLARTSGGSATGLICGIRRLDVVVSRTGRSGGRFSVSVAVP